MRAMPTAPIIPKVAGISEWDAPLPVGVGVVPVPVPVLSPELVVSLFPVELGLSVGEEPDPVD